MKGSGSMLYVGIDVAKNKHDCFITDSNGEQSAAFTVENSMAGFNMLYKKILSFTDAPCLLNTKVGLEATGHYSNNIIEFLTTKNLNPVIFNPLHTNLYRKGLSLRKVKTDKSDARFITMMLMTEDVKPYSPVSYHISELKALSRNRFRLVKQRSRAKVTLSRLIDVIFPELAAHVWSISQKSVLMMLLEFPNTKAISSCRLTKLTNLLSKNSHGKYGCVKADEIKTLAKGSIGSNSPALAFELRQTIRSILFFQNEISLLDEQIKLLVDGIKSPLMSVPGISYTLTAVILSEIGDINRFDTPAKLLAFAGIEPSTHQSGNYTATHNAMVKRGSKYLRWAMLEAARLVCMRNQAFASLRGKKIAEGKHYFVALSHVAKKLNRVIFHLLKTGESFDCQLI
jgi:transposase